MAFRLSEQERALVLLWRAFLAYQNERATGHALTLEDHSEEAVQLVVHNDGSGWVRVDPADPNQREFNGAEWWDLPQGPAKLNAATGVLIARRLMHETGRPRFGNPQRGRAKGRA